MYPLYCCYTDMANMVHLILSILISQVIDHNNINYNSFKPYFGAFPEGVIS